MKIFRRLPIIATLLISFIAGSEIDTIKSNSFPVTNGFQVPGPGLYFNQAGAVAAINIFMKYPAMVEAIKSGASLVSNLETKIIYQEKYFTNTININDNSLQLYQAHVKQSLNRSFIVSLSAVGLGIFGGVLAGSDNQGVSYVGLGMIGAATITIPVSYLIARFKKYRGFKNE